MVGKDLAPCTALKSPSLGIEFPVSLFSDASDLLLAAGAVLRLRARCTYNCYYYSFKKAGI